MPQNPIDVLGLFDVTYGAGFTLIVMAIILATLTLAIYIRTKSLPMLTILGLYEVGAFGAILTNNIVSSQYHIFIYVAIFGAVTAGMMLILRLVKE